MIYKYVGPSDGYCPGGMPYDIDGDTLDALAERLGMPKDYLLTYYEAQDSAPKKASRAKRAGADSQPPTGEE